VAQDPQLIRRDIEQTRHHMGDTADALAYKANVPARTKDRVSGAVDSLRGRTPDAGQVKGGAKQAVSTAESNPLGLAIGFAAAGFIAGLLAPGTRVENEKLGPMSDQLTEQVKETAQEAVDRGKQVAQETVQTAQETAQEKASEHGSELKQSAQENAQSVTSS
jgi:gas vesicle protein